MIKQASLVGKDLFKINGGWFRTQIFTKSFVTHGIHEISFYKSKF